MKKLIFASILFTFFQGELTTSQTQDFQEFVQDVKKNISIERYYKIGTEENLVLAPGQAVHLDFEDNPSGVKEFIFFYDEEEVHLIYRYFSNTEKEYQGTSLNLERKEGFRGTREKGDVPWLWLFYKFEPKGGKAFVKFRTTEKLTDEDQIQVKEIDRMRELRTAAKLRAIEELEWDFGQKIKPLNFIMDDPNDPNMVKLREKYNLEGLVSDAKDGYEKLKLITKWAQKRWQHNGDNHPSKPDPLTILQEASEGKRFRCVEYAKVVAACARSLGMPSRVLALKRSDVETAKSGAGHVVAEVWLSQFNKWVFVDGQWGAIPEKDGVPLNAVEFQGAIARESPGLRVFFAKEEDEKNYLIWVASYLYYFDFNLDQRFYKAETEDERISGSRGKVMLVPKGAKNPGVFQRNTPIRNCTYISNPEAFYPDMSQ